MVIITINALDQISRTRKSINTVQFYVQIIKAVHTKAENKKLHVRFTSLFELREIPYIRGLISTNSRQIR